MTTRVAVIGGGQNCEHEVSLASAAGVAAALDPTSYEVVPLTIGPDGTWRDRGQRPMGLAGVAQVLRGCQVAFPVVHGPRGEDGTLAALCELAGLRYVGSGVGAGALAMDKWATKLVAEALGIATAPARLVTAATAHLEAWTSPVVVKPVAAGSSRGVTLVREADALGPALEAALALGPRALVEDVVVGREIDVAVLRRADGSLVDLAGPRDRRRRALRLRREVRRPRGLPGPGSASTTATPRRSRTPRSRCTTPSAAPVSCASTSSSPTTARAQRGEHDPRHDRALAGAADVRCRGPRLPRPPRRAGPRRPLVSGGRVAGLDLAALADRLLGVVRLRRHALTHLAGGPVIADRSRVLA